MKRYALTLCCLLLCGACSPAVGPPSMEHGDDRASTALWRLDNLETVGGHPVTVEGDPQVIDTPHGKAIEFDGVDDALFLDAHPLEGLATFTVEVVFKPYTDGASEQRFFHMQEAGSASRVMFETRLVEAGGWFLDTYIRNGEEGVTLYAEDDTHPTDQWHHAAIVVDGSTFSHYVDGRLELSEELRYRPQGPGLTSIGVRINRIDWFRGAIRTIRITPLPLAPEAFLTAED